MTWVTDDNTARPHSALGCQTPADFALHLNTAITRPAARDETRAPGDCPTRAERRKSANGSARSSMKDQWQVRGYSCGPAILSFRPGNLARDINPLSTEPAAAQSDQRLNPSRFMAHYSERVRRPDSIHKV